MPKEPLKLSASGCIKSLIIGSKHFDFRENEYAGPKWYGEWDGSKHKIVLSGSVMHFEGGEGPISFSIDYALLSDRLVITAAIANHGRTPFIPVKAGLKLGLDTYMQSRPEWNQKLFPTLLRCEKTHFWGYAMSPEGAILGIGSPEPVASWSLDYNRAGDSPDSDWGHRVYTLNLDLMNSLPLPARHPQDLGELAAGETKSWAITLIPVSDLADIKPVLAKVCSAPMLDADRYILAEGESTNIRVYCDDPVNLQITGPDGESVKFDTGNFTVPERAGEYTLTAASDSGKISQARLYVRHPWSWYLKQARVAAVEKPQKASCCCESWYGHFSSFLALRHFADHELDAQAEANFRTILPLMFDTQSGVPTLLPDRIQNTCTMISMLADLYQAKGNIADLELAAKLADWIITHQHKDGSYKGQNGGHYTCVIYAAKSIIELALIEKELTVDNSDWEYKYKRHMASAKAAVDNLQRLGDNIGTEGEATFEDGMISCSALQLALFALLQDDKSCRDKYTKAALDLLSRHRCLEQSIVPDARMTGCTLRFWEAQYDVLIDQNMITSPHGWSSWKTYATWYLYLLNGSEDLLRQTMETLGACVQMIDSDSGELRWAFVVDPYIRASVWDQDDDNPGSGARRERVIGEQYVDMISGWWKAPPDTVTGGYWDQGGCCDNDVHEHFKCLEEVALTSAYVIERKDGSFGAWNCRVERAGDKIYVYPYEDIVDSVHVNLKKSHLVDVHFSDGVTSMNAAGMQWIRS